MALEALARAQARAAPDDGEVWLLMGQAFLASKKIKDAEACRQRAMESGGYTYPMMCLDAHIHQVSTEVSC